jgi:hypothetical protein
MTDADYARERIAYDPTTGRMTWRIKPSRAVNAGDRTGHTDDGKGYGRVKLWGRQHQAHRIAWLISRGEWPAGDIDHINGDRADNRLANLRDVPSTVNAENRRTASRHAATKVLGVSMEGTRFKARVRVNKREVYLGLFDTAEQAHAAYLKAKRELHAGCTI